jgi:ribosomal protein S27AE
MINMDGAIEVTPICPRCGKLATFAAAAGKSLFEPVNVVCGPCAGTNGTEPEVTGRAPQFIALDDLAKIIAAVVNVAALVK